MTAHSIYQYRKDKKGWQEWINLYVQTSIQDFYFDTLKSLLS